VKDTVLVEGEHQALVAIGEDQIWPFAGDSGRIVAQHPVEIPFVECHRNRVGLIAFLYRLRDLEIEGERVPFPIVDYRPAAHLWIPLLKSLNILIYA
jgi:hypothetical protein